MILGGRGSKLIRKVVTTYENQRHWFRTNIRSENF